MAKAAITKKYSLSASGILGIDGQAIGIENTETGEFVDLQTLLSDFADKPVKLKVDYDEEYEPAINTDAE